MPSPVSRRDLIALAGTVGVLAPLSTQLLSAAQAAEEVPAEPYPETGNEALARLKAGNVRFVSGKTRHAHESANWRKHLVGTQRPIATILGCSDSRVPPELVFDQGFGDLFVIRVAGNVIAPDVVGSMAYAALHLRTPLFVVLGHGGCGAVTAALEERLKGTKDVESIEGLLKLVDPALRRVDLKGPFAATLAAAIEANVRWSVEQLAALPSAKQLLADSKVVLAGAVYDLQNGSVRFLDA